MQSFEDREVMPFSFTCKVPEDDLGHHHLQQRTNLNQHKEILQFLKVLSLVKSSHLDNHHLQKESFSLEIGCCGLFQAIPLPDIGEMVLPHWSKVTRRVLSPKESLGLQQKDLLEKVFSLFNGTIIASWLERAHDLISEPNRWRTLHTLCTFLTFRAPP